jgi:hypothetical protein
LSEYASIEKITWSQTLKEVTWKKSINVRKTGYVGEKISRQRKQPALRLLVSKASLDC